MELAELEILAAEIVDWAGHLAAGTAAWLGMIARFDAAEGYARWECQSCAHWLNWQCGLELRAAREHVRVARRLEELPVLRAAFARGELSYSKVRAITRVANADTEAELVMLAAHAMAAQLERIVAACVKVGRLASPEEALVRHRSRGVFLGWDDDGTLTVSARLPPEVGAVVLKALAHAEAALPAEAARDELAARRADSLAMVAAAYLDGACDAASHERYQVFVHVDADVLLETPAPGSAGPHDDAQPEEPAAAPAEPDRDPRQRAAAGRASPGAPPGPNDPGAPDGPAAPDQAGKPGTAAGSRETGQPGRSGGVDEPGVAERSVGRCHLEHGPSLAPETVRRLACDATWAAVVDGVDGGPIGIGRRSRRVPARLRRFLETRDGGCRFPACPSRRTHAHHLQHWTAGGPTDPENLILLCAFHHHRLHEGRWSARGRAHGVVEFRDQFGLLLGTTAPPGGSTEPLHALPVRPQAIACRWAGERLDLDHITTSLFNRPTPRPAAAATTALV